MKRATFIILFLLLTTAGFAQVNFYKFALGGGIGTTVSYADLREKNPGYGIYGEAIYNLSPFLTTSLEIQAGKIRGGNRLTNPHFREFANSYKTFSLNVKLAIGQFLDYQGNPLLSVIKGTYLGIGVGAISNNLTDIVRYKPNTEVEYPPYGYLFPGKDKSVNLLVPVNLGMNIYFHDSNDVLRYIFNFNLQGNITFGEGMDGYDDPNATFTNNAPDIYTLFSVGVKYNFGPVGLSKRIF